MARGRIKRKPIVRIEHVDATPERIRMDESEFINPAEIDSSEQQISLTRRFRSSHLDRLYRKDDPRSPLDYRQWQAGDSYRTLHHKARFTMRVVASYGERTTGGEPSYGLPITQSQLRARQDIAEARKEWPQGMQGYMERLIIHNELPRYAGRAAARNLAAIRLALDAMAKHFKISC